VDELKTASYVNSLFLKAYEYSKINTQIKFLFIDIPIHKEIEYFYNFFFNQNNLVDSKEENLFSSSLTVFLRLNILYEKLFWITEVIKGQCPVCNSGIKIEKAYDSLENLMDNYMISIPENIRIRNLSDKIINSMNLFNDEEKILVFVKENSFLNVVNQVLKDLSNHEKIDEINDINLSQISILENMRNKNLDIYKEFNSIFIFI